MDRQALFDRIIECVYDSATDPEAQPRLPADVGALLDSHCANFRIVRARESVASHWHGFGEQSAGFFERGVAENEWRKSLLASKGTLGVGVHFGSEGILHRDLVKTKFYTDYCKPFGIDYSMAAYFLCRDEDLGILGVYRGRKRGDFQPQDAQLLGKLLPHLARSAAFADRLRHAELLRSSGEGAWNLVPWGVLLLGCGGRIVFANCVAETILQRSDGLAARCGRLIATERVEMARLTALLERASATTCGPLIGGAMPVRRQDAARPLQVWVMPLPRAAPAFPLLEPLASVCVLLIDPDREIAPLTGGLRLLYGLTRAEAGLVAGLLRGERLEDYAARAGITLNTARTHLKAVFGKTDTHRQSELMRLLSSVPFVVES